jgi:hypothetical protein
VSDKQRVDLEPIRATLERYRELDAIIASSEVKRDQLRDEWSAYLLRSAPEARVIFGELDGSGVVSVIRPKVEMMIRLAADLGIKAAD